MRLALLALLALSFPSLSAAEPRVLDARYQLELVASEPQIVTPVAIAFDRAGRLLVIESHTHQRPDEYEGPKFDRIRCLTDADQNGKLDEAVTTYYEGSSQTMSLALSPNGEMLVATRREIFRLTDANNDGKAEARTSLVRLVTEGDYPHNGLAGLTFDSAGQLYFGLGENLGESYELVGSDGSKISGGGEGGSVFRCTADGKHLERIATGVWNPFGNGFDPHGRLYSVDNDPDASPPCRLLRIVPTADFGYQFRYGRTGRHPLQAWNGEFPGTLPMTAGTGEAPCQVIAHQGRLWVTSWGDHRLETYTIQPEGAGCRAIQQVVVQGDAEFRPVGLAIAEDGSVFFSDWVDRSYPVHGRGRVWRLSLKPGENPGSEKFPPLSSEEQQAEQLHHKPTIEALASEDPFLRQAAIYGWSQNAKLAGVSCFELTDAAQRLGILQAMAWRDAKLPSATIRQALDDSSEDVRMFALRLIADGRRDEMQDKVEQLVRSDSTSPRVWRAAVATMIWLAEGEESKDTSKLHEMLASVISDPESSDTQRLRALRYLPPDHEKLAPAELRDLFETTALRQEIVDVLSQRNDDDAGNLLATIADRGNYSVEIRANALAALAAHRDTHAEVFDTLGQEDRPATLQREAERGLRNQRITQQPRPAPTDVDAWLAAIENRGDLNAGRRVFFRAVGGRCSECHRYRERGAAVGPELTTIHRRATRRWLLESILTPNREVAPQFTSVALISEDGRTYTGLPSGGPADTGKEVLLKPDGTTESINLSEIVERHALTTSIMPTGLGELLTVDEMADLIAFLLDGSGS